MFLDLNLLIFIWTDIALFVATHIVNIHFFYNLLYKKVYIILYRIRILRLLKQLFITYKGYSMDNRYNISEYTFAVLVFLILLTPVASSGELYSSQEHQMLELINHERLNHGLEPLALNTLLTQAARDHSREMIDKDFFSHYSYDGTHFSQRISATGYPLYRVGENIAMCMPPDVVKAHSNLMGSPGHRANILNADYNEVGIGIWVGDYSSYPNTAMYTQNFGWDPDLNIQDPLSITGFSPLSTTLVSSGDDQLFSIQANDECDISWSVDGIIVRTDKDVISSSFNMIAPAQGMYDIKADVVSSMGIDSVSWSMEVTVSGSMKGDFDRNGVVDFYDFVEFAGSYNSKSGDSNYSCIFDFDDNGVIDFYDFVEFAAVYNA